MKNVCIVGYGKIGPNHARAFEGIENAKLYAVCDINPERIKKCQETFDVIGYTDFDEMLKDENIYSVHICTPHYLHFNMIVKALKAGKTVVSEKPVTMTKEQFEELKNTEGSDKICLVFQNRLNDCSKKFKEIIDSGVMGNPIAAKAVVTWNRSAEYYLEDEWRGKWATEGGGVLINQTVHSLDLLSYFAGDICSVKANMMNYSLENVIEVEDTMVAYLGFANGIKGMFFATNSFPVNSPVDIELVFENGTAKCVNDKLFINDEIVAENEKPKIGKAYWGSSHKRLLKEFYDEGKYFTINDAENTMYALYAMYESAKNDGKEVLI